MPEVYLDHITTTPVAPQVEEAMRPFFLTRFGSPTSVHRHGLLARDALLTARTQLAALLNAPDPEEILFTSGGTESLNLAIRGLALGWASERGHLVVSSIEHPAVLNATARLQNEGFSVTRIPVDTQGRIDPAAVEAALQPDTRLVCIHLGNPDAGTLQPVEEICQRVGARGIPLLIDANHAAGWVPIDVQRLPPVMVSLSPHRFFGPKGVGVLYRHRRCRIKPILDGGLQEGGRRPGTENMPGIVGAGVAADLARSQRTSRAAHAREVVERLWAGIRTSIPDTQLHGPPPGPDRLPHQLSVSFARTEGEGLALMLDMQGIAVGSGPSCIAGPLKTSHVLAAMGVEPRLALGTLTLSPGPATRPEEIDAVLAALGSVVRRMRDMMPGGAGPVPQPLG